MYEMDILTSTLSLASLLNLSHEIPTYKREIKDKVFVTMEIIIVYSKISFRPLVRTNAPSTSYWESSCWLSSYFPHWVCQWSKGSTVHNPMLLFQRCLLSMMG
jgi:hypothetical protein